MRCLCGVVLAVLGGFLAGPVRGAEEAKLVLETPAATLELARSPAPHIAQLVHKASGTAVVADPAEDSLLCIEMDQLPLRRVAATLLDNQFQNVELAARLHTRTDVPWMSL